MNYMILPLKRYLDFKGRSRRKEYWMFFLFTIIALVVAMILDSALGLGGSTSGSTEFGDGTVSASGSASGGIITMILYIGLLIPSIAVGVRRMHDHDKSGWFLLVPIYNLILALTEGTKGPNRFGADPKAENASAAFA